MQTEYELFLFGFCFSFKNFSKDSSFWKNFLCTRQDNKRNSHRRTIRARSLNSCDPLFTCTPFVTSAATSTDMGRIPIDCQTRVLVVIKVDIYGFYFHYSHKWTREMQWTLARLEFNRVVRFKKCEGLEQCSYRRDSSLFQLYTFLLLRCL